MPRLNQADQGHEMDPTCALVRRRYPLPAVSPGRCTQGTRTPTPCISPAMSESTSPATSDVTRLRTHPAPRHPKPRYGAPAPHRALTRRARPRVGTRPASAPGRQARPAGQPASRARQTACHGLPAGITKARPRCGGAGRGTFFSVWGGGLVNWGWCWYQFDTVWVVVDTKVLSLRLPVGVHAELVVAARRNARSVNAEIVWRVSCGGSGQAGSVSGSVVVGGVSGSSAGGAVSDGVGGEGRRRDVGGVGVGSAVRGVSSGRSVAARSGLCVHRLRPDQFCARCDG